MLRFRIIRSRQFSLTTLFVVVTLAALVAAGYGMRRRALLAEDQALTKISKRGGWVLLYQEGAYVEFFPQVPPGRLTIDCGTGLQRTYGPSGTSNDFRDGDLALFDDVRRLQSVDFRNTQVSPTAVEQFRLKHPMCHVRF